MKLKELLESIGHEENAKNFEFKVVDKNLSVIIEQGKEIAQLRIVDGEIICNLTGV